MAIKKHLLIIFFFIIVFIIFQNLKNINENFSSNYISEKHGEYNFLLSNPKIFNPYVSKNINVQLTSAITNPLKLKYNPYSEIQLKINSKITSLFPFQQIPYQNINQMIISANKDKNIISYLNEDIFLEKYLGLKGRKFNNLRFVCALSYSHFTLITTLNSNILNWHDLENKNIGTINNSTSLINLKSLLSILKYNKNRITISVVENELDLKKIFLKSKIDAIYLTIEHPSLLIKEISKSIRIRIITTEGLPEDKLKLIYPSLFKGKIDIRDYDHYPVLNPFLNTYATRILLISNIMTKDEYIYNFIQTLFKNMNYIRSGIKELKYLNLNFVSFAFAITIYQKGAEKFYNEHNYISSNKEELCDLYYGTNTKCNKSHINQNRFIVDKGDPLNYKFNFTVLSPQKKWVNIIDDWNFNGNGRRFKDSLEYHNDSDKPLLVSELSQDTNATQIFQNYIQQIKYTSNQLFPNL